MDAKTVFTFAGGMVAGLILGVLLFSGPSGTTQGPGSAGPVAPPPSQVDTIKIQQDNAQLEQILKGDPKNYQAWKKLGDNYFDIGDHSKSVDAYGKALALDDSDANVWTDMGVMYRRLGQFEKAVESFQTATEKGPTHTVSRLNLGVVYVNDLKDFNKGIAAWEDFLRLEPSGQRADSIRGQLGQIKQMMQTREGGGATAPAPGAAAPPADPSSYFPKPATP